MLFKKKKKSNTKRNAPHCRKDTSEVFVDRHSISMLSHLFFENGRNQRRPENPADRLVEWHSPPDASQARSGCVGLANTQIFLTFSQHPAWTVRTVRPSDSRGTPRSGSGVPGKFCPAEDGRDTRGLPSPTSLTDCALIPAIGARVSRNSISSPASHRLLTS